MLLNITVTVNYKRNKFPELLKSISSLKRNMGSVGLMFFSEYETIPISGPRASGGAQILISTGVSTAGQKGETGYSQIKTSSGDMRLSGSAADPVYTGSVVWTSLLDVN